MKPRTDAMERIVAGRIKQERLAAGVTQLELAEAAGFSTQQLAKVEAGINRIKAGRLWLVAQRIGVPIGDLFRESRRSQQPSLLERRFVRATRQVPARLIAPLAAMVRALNGRDSDVYEQEKAK